MEKIKTIILLFVFIWAASLCGAEPALKDVFKDKYLIGAAMNTSQISRDDAVEDKLIRDNFNSITAENAMKWEKIHPEDGKYDFTLADKFVEFGCDNNMFITGHTLIWHSQTPGWVFQDADGKPASRELLLERMKDHIFTVVGRYKGRVRAWDVVNEAVDSDGGLRRWSPWSKTIGDDFVAKAFEYAHQADPDAELYYNDFDMWKKDHRNGVIRLVKELQSKGLRIDGIGMQGHWGLDYPDLAEVEESIMAYSALGVKVMVTELDITVLPKASLQSGADVSQNFEYRKELDPYSNGLPEEVQTQLTERYGEVFALFNKHADNISRVTFWGVQDGNSWRNDWPIQGRTDYPLIFDRDCEPKEAFKIIVDSVGK